MVRFTEKIVHHHQTDCLPEVSRSLLTVCLLTVVCFAWPQDESEEILSPGAVREAYNAMRYGEVIEMVKRELESRPSQDREDLRLYLKYLSLALFVEEGEEAAVGALTSLLLVDPDFEFSEGEVSPKVLTLFEGIKTEGEFQTDREETVEAYVVVKDSRSAEILASALFPGRGHLLRDQPRGYIYGTLFALSLGGGLYSAYLMGKNHETYLKSTQLTAIDLAYNDYNLSYKARNNLLLLSLLTYLASLADVILTSE